MADPPLVSAHAARRLLMAGKGLLADPARRATPAAIRKQIEQMGFVQVDTISVAARAHDHVIQTRFDDYEPRMLRKLLERDRTLFEHWTHDASIIPVTWRPWWRPRYRRYEERIQRHGWWRERLGDDPEGLFAYVEGRIRDEGPLMSRDFAPDSDEKAGAWWGWTPTKAALEHLWRRGRLVVTKRQGFQKVYDLAERVFPDEDHDDVPDHDAHVDWACRAAIERLGVATPAEIAGYLAAITLSDATAWCKRAVKGGDVVRVTTTDARGERPRAAFARPDWERAAQRAHDAPDRMRLLSPFDPLVRDRKRLERLFGFDYRFEAFVPAPKRVYGYYVLPLLDGDELVGRADVKMHRSESLFEVKGLWWEDGVTPTARLRRRLEAAVDVYAAAHGAEHWQLP